jgi:hypothetical protein
MQAAKSDPWRHVTSPIEPQGQNNLPISLAQSLPLYIFSVNLYPYMTVGKE